MENKNSPWPERFGLTRCPAAGLDAAVAATALGIAVVYSAETVFLVIESRARSLRAECARRLGTVAFLAEVLPEATREAVDAACRRQVILAGELRRALRPAMR
jgi:hypothetical protein